MMCSEKILKDWERQPGESNLWYDRFHKFLMYGSSRTVNGTYRDTINETRDMQGRERLGKAAAAPSSWRKIVKQWEWISREEKYDEEKRRLAQNAVNDAIDMVRLAAGRAVKFQIGLMDGVIKIGGQEIRLTIEEIAQMRLASNSILNRAGVVHEGASASEEDGRRQITEIRIVDQMERDD